MPKRLTQEEFILKSKEIHGDKYDYSKVSYINNRTKVCIICPEHGEFWMIPDSHLRKRGCPMCGTRAAQMKNRLTQGEFIKRAKEIHKNKYDYTKSIYVNNDTKVCIICPEHGEFWQTPHHHLRGIGCASCGRNNISEQKLYEIIKTEFQDALEQYNDVFLTDNSHKQYIDIYIPSKKIGIEYQGRQHFMPISRFGGETEFKKIIERDNKKYLKSKENGLKLFYFSYEKEIPETYIDTVFTNENKLIEQIKKYDNRL